MTSASAAPPPAPPCPDAQPGGACRRTILRGAAGLGVLGLAGGALSGCGGAASAQPVAAAQAPAPARGGGSRTLGPAADIPVGGGSVFGDDKVVVTQPTKGEFKAFTAVCTHTGCIVSEVADGTIGCPCHGSRFSITDGSVVAPPAPAPHAAKTVTVVDGNVTVVL
jgi:Rieske Fe-S protein